MAGDAGQVYYTLLQEREDKGIKDVAISRVEQVSPFPYDLVRPHVLVSCAASITLFAPQLTPHLDTYPNAELLWCQVSNSYVHLFDMLIICTRRRSR